MTGDPTDFAAALPAWMTPQDRTRYAELVTLVRSVTAHLPHHDDKFAEPGHGFDLHVRPQPHGSSEGEVAIV